MGSGSTAEDGQLRNELDGLRREISGLRVEWEEWYDKYRTLYARIARRVDRLQQLENAPESPRTNDPAQTDIQWDPGRQAIQEEVMKRRRTRAV